MNNYIISYDLIAPNKDYSELYNAIRNYGTFAHVLDSVWIVNSSSNSSDIRNNLKSYVDSNDQIFVAKLNGESSWMNLSNEVSNWIQKHT